MKPYVPSTRVAVRESFEEDLSDDIEDDVFIRDGKSIKVRICTGNIVHLYDFKVINCFALFYVHLIYSSIMKRRD